MDDHYNIFVMNQWFIQSCLLKMNNNIASFNSRIVFHNQKTDYCSNLKDFAKLFILALISIRLCTAMNVNMTKLNNRWLLIQINVLCKPHPFRVVTLMTDLKRSLLKNHVLYIVALYYIVTEAVAILLVHNMCSVCNWRSNWKASCG